MSTIFAGVLRHQNCLYIFVQKLSETPIFRYILDLGFDACIFSVWDVYWRNQNQAWTFRAGSRTPSLDSKMCKFPRISLSELWKVRSFRLILDSGFAGQFFLCRIPVNKGPKMKLLSRKLDSGFGGNFCQEQTQAWHHLFRPKPDSLSHFSFWW